jgi:hypothetical protein
MERWTRRTVKISVVAIAAALMTGCMVMHALSPHAHPPEASEFGMGPRRSAEGFYTAALIADEPLRTKTLQAVRIAVADAAGTPVEGATITIDGGMPAHGHGLPTRPRITRELGGGEYLVEGLRFNMGGWWVLEFDVVTANAGDRVTFNLSL